MGDHPPARPHWVRLVLRVPRLVVWIVGLAVVLRQGVEALGGAERLWQFTRTDQNRYVAMAMLTGTLRLRGSLARLGFDEQVYNGAVYTNWGYGAPLMQLPFHALAAHSSAHPSFEPHFFPDRAIFFGYFAALAVLLWTAFSRLVAMRSSALSALTRDALSWAAASLVLASALCPLMACRFIVYEETIAYFVLCELASLSFFVLATQSTSSWPVAALAVTSALGMLVRPTGLIYMAGWGTLAALEARSRRARLTFALAGAPLVAFWAYTNWVKTGSPVGLGFSNVIVPSVAQTAEMRFGSTCVEGGRHVAQVAATLFSALFVLVPDAPRWLQSCNFRFEERPPAAHEPFLGLTVLALLAWILVSHAMRGERRLAVYVPFAGIAIVFAGYVYAGAGLAWRYVGDFWPFIVLACVQYVRALPAAANRLLGVPLAVVLAIAGQGCQRRSLEPWLPGGYYGDHWETLPPQSVASVWDDFTKSRYERDAPLPSRVDCGHALGWPPSNAIGWSADCDHDVATNLFLGVPRKPPRAPYEIRIRTHDKGAPQLTVYVNGRLYTARWDGAEYRASVFIPYERLHSAMVLATIEWTSSHAGKLLSVEIT